MRSVMSVVLFVVRNHCIHGHKKTRRLAAACSLVLWFFGSLVLWFFGSLVFWFFGSARRAPGLK
jgi:hypothetical protein